MPQLPVNTALWLARGAALAMLAGGAVAIWSNATRPAATPTAGDATDPSQTDPLVDPGTSTTDAPATDDPASTDGQATGTPTADPADASSPGPATSVAGVDLPSLAERLNEFKNAPRPAPAPAPGSGDAAAPEVVVDDAPDDPDPSPVIDVAYVGTVRQGERLVALVKVNGRQRFLGEGDEATFPPPPSAIAPNQPLVNQPGANPAVANQPNQPQPNQTQQNQGGDRASNAQREPGRGTRAAPGQPEVPLGQGAIASPLKPTGEAVRLRIDRVTPDEVAYTDLTTSLQGRSTKLARNSTASAITVGAATGAAPTADVNAAATPAPVTAPTEAAADDIRSRLTPEQRERFDQAREARDQARERARRAREQNENRN